MIPKFRFFCTSGMSGVLSINLEDEEVELDDGDIRRIEEGKLIQSTGLHDVYGVEIFEGDIVRWEEIELNYIVTYSEEYGIWYCEPISATPRQWDYFLIWKKVAVIGNKFENLELLKVKG